MSSEERTDTEDQDGMEDHDPAELPTDDEEDGLPVLEDNGVSPDMTPRGDPQPDEAEERERAAVRLQCFMRKFKAKEVRAELKKKRDGDFQAEIDSGLEVASACAIQEKFRAYKGNKSRKDEEEADTEAEEQKKQDHDRLRAQKSLNTLIRRQTVLEDQETERRLKVEAAEEDALLRCYLERDRIQRLVKKMRRDARRNKKAGKGFSSQERWAEEEEEEVDLNDDSHYHSPSPSPARGSGHSSSSPTRGVFTLNNGIVGDLFLKYDSQRRMLLKDERNVFRKLTANYKFGHNVGKHSIPLMAHESCKRELLEELSVNGFVVILLGFNKKNRDHDGDFTGYYPEEKKTSLGVVLPSVGGSNTGVGEEGGSPAAKKPQSTPLPSLTKTLQAKGGDATSALEAYEDGDREEQEAKRTTAPFLVPATNHRSATVTVAGPGGNSENLPVPRQKFLLTHQCAYDGAMTATERARSTGTLVPHAPKMNEVEHRLRRFPLTGRGGTVRHLSSLLDRFDSEVANPAPVELRKAVTSKEVSEGDSRKTFPEESE